MCNIVYTYIFCIRSLAFVFMATATVCRKANEYTLYLLNKRPFLMSALVQKIYLI